MAFGQIHNIRTNVKYFKESGISGGTILELFGKAVKLFNRFCKVVNIKQERNRSVTEMMDLVIKKAPDAITMTLISVVKAPSPEL